MIGRLLELVIARSRRKAWEGSAGWLAAGAAAWLWRRSRARRDPHPVWSEDLRPGESVLIVHEAG